MALEKIHGIQAILFDADGVVIFPNRFSLYLERELHLTQDRMRQFFGGVFLECLIGRADLKDVIEPFLPQWGWPGSIDEFLLRWFDEEKAVDQRIIDFIVTLRQQRYLCGLATNQEWYRLEYMKSEMGFSAIFDEIFSSAAIGAMKNYISER